MFASSLGVNPWVALIGGTAASMAAKSALQSAGTFTKEGHRSLEIGLEQLLSETALLCDRISDGADALGKAVESGVESCVRPSILDSGYSRPITGQYRH